MQEFAISLCFLKEGTQFGSDKDFFKLQKFGLVVSFCWDKTVFNYYSLHHSVVKNKVLIN